MRNPLTSHSELSSQHKVQLRVKILLQVSEDVDLFSMSQPMIPIHCVISLDDFFPIFIRNDSSFIKKVVNIISKKNKSNSNQVLKDMKVLSCDRELTVSLEDLWFEWFIKSDTRPTITTNYLVIVSVPFKVRKIVMATAYF